MHFFYRRTNVEKKQKRDTASSKDDELDILRDDVDSFTLGSHADLESAADNLFTSPPRPQPLPFSSLSIKTPAKTIPPTPGTALQHKICITHKPPGAPMGKTPLPILTELEHQARQNISTLNFTAAFDFIFLQCHS